MQPMSRWLVTVILFGSICAVARAGALLPRARCDPDDTDPCVANAVCNANDEGSCLCASNCECSTGFYDNGAVCAIRTSDCNGHLCLHGATCVDSVPNNDDYTCLCTPGCTGKFCESGIGDCADNRCRNGATCVDGLSDDGTYSCLCRLGYRGNFCGEDIDDCDPDPCGANGACRDIGANEFTCDCSPGYQGRFCQNDIDPCDPNRCLHGGACIASGPSTYSCDCLSGFQGGNCETVITTTTPTTTPAATTKFEGECVSNPCQNSGICIDDGNGFKCSCPDGYTGNRCQTGCQNGFSMLGRRCVQIITDELPRQESDDACRASGARLLRIDSAEEFSDLTTFLLVNGYTDPNDGFWLDGDDPDTDWTFVSIYDASYVIPFISWCSGHPTNGNKKCLGVFADGSTSSACYVNKNCENHQNYICEAPTVCELDGVSCTEKKVITTTTPTTTPAATTKFEVVRTCPDGYVEFGEGCIKVVDDPKLKRNYAKDGCEDTGGKLFLVNDRPEFDELSQFLQDNGHTTAGANEEFWLDGDAKGGKFSSIYDNSFEIPIHGWCGGTQPNNKDKCLGISVGGTASSVCFNAIKCGDRISYICEAPFQ